ncbi:tail protein X [Pararhodospirillum photometricum]|nr:tail protein X [Pararhodospirillum photometricum]
MPSTTLYAQQGDTVDLVCLRHYGDTRLVEAVFDANPGLAALGHRLPLGTPVTLPERVVTPTPGYRLWE